MAVSKHLPGKAKVQSLEPSTHVKLNAVASVYKSSVPTWEVQTRESLEACRPASLANKTISKQSGR